MWPFEVPGKGTRGFPEGTPLAYWGLQHSCGQLCATHTVCLNSWLRNLPGWSSTPRVLAEL